MFSLCFSIRRLSVSPKAPRYYSILKTVGSPRKRLRSVTDEEGSVPAPRKFSCGATKAVSIGNRSDNDRKKILSNRALIQEVSKMAENKEKAEVMILELMTKYSFDLSRLKHLLGQHNLGVSFSKVQYDDIAPLVGLDPYAGGRDIPTFEMFYARLPNEIFLLIVNDIRMFGAQYGRMIDHKNEEARSRYLSSYYNRIVALFSGNLINTPGTLIEGRITTKGRIEYQFQTYGAINVVLIEVKLEIGNQQERLNFVAQVIAECDASAWMNRQMGFDVPIMAILCDGNNFFFYRFMGECCEASRQLFLGEFPNGGMGIHIEDMFVGAAVDPLSFYRNLRRICDTLYYVFLSGYQSGVEAYWKRSVEKDKTEGKGRESASEWHKVTVLASKALEEAKSAWNLHNGGKVKESEESAKRAAKFLAESIDEAPVVKPIIFA